MRFKDQVVWITGASSGIGEGLAYAFHREGAHVVLSARRETELARVKAACTGPGEILLVAFDMIDEAGRAAAVAQVSAHFGRVDMLVNNAGISQRSLARDTALAVDRRIMELDYFAVIDLTKRVLPGMIARRTGHLVATSSVGGKFGSWNRSTYCAAKHALHGFFDTLRLELFRDRIDVSLLVIGNVQTDIAFHALTGDGTPTSRRETVPPDGLTIHQCAAQVLDGLARKDHEIVIVAPSLRKMLWLARLWPRRLFRTMIAMAPR